MTSPPILATTPLSPWLEERLGTLGTLRPLADALADGSAAEARVLVTTGTHGADAALMDALPALGLIAVHGVGYDPVDVDHARRRGIAVTNTPDVLTDDVADMAMALLLATARRIVGNDRYVRDGRWGVTPVPPLTRRVSGARFGILGLGRIGAAIARRLEPYGGTIAYHNRRPVAGSAYRYRPDPVTLAAESDVLIVATSGGAGTAGLVDAAVLDALGADGILINVGRGSIVDEPALVAALEAGRLGGAGLDVFEDEPHVPERLRALEQVVLQPHAASATVETRMAMAALVADNVAAFLGGKPLLTPV